MLNDILADAHEILHHVQIRISQNRQLPLLQIQVPLPVARLPRFLVVLASVQLDYEIRAGNIKIQKKRGRRLSACVP